MAGRRQKWVYRIEPSLFPPDFSKRLESFREAAGLSSRGLARLLRVDNRTLRRWRRGTTPGPGHLVALFDIAAGMGMLHILLPSVMVAPLTHESDTAQRRSAEIYIQATYGS